MKKAAEGGSRAEILRVLDPLHSESAGPLADQELKPSAQFGAGLRTQFAAWLPLQLASHECHFQSVAGQARQENNGGEKGPLQTSLEEKVAKTGRRSHHLERGSGCP